MVGREPAEPIRLWTLCKTRHPLKGGHAVVAEAGSPHFLAKRKWGWFTEGDSLLANELALKGGTAINLMIFDLPRLSVDIDMDFAIDADREKMLEERSLVTERIQKHMAADGYVLSQKSKQTHALDSFVYEYVNAGGVKDNLKIEINYMLRSHVFPPARQKIKLPWQMGESTVLCVNSIELFAAKIAALLNL